MPAEYGSSQLRWGIYQRMITAYRHPDRARGRELMAHLIESLTRGVPAVLPELATLGQTLTKRVADVLAFFDLPGTSNGPTEAVNGRPEHLRGSALGFRNLTNRLSAVAAPCRPGLRQAHASSRAFLMPPCPWTRAARVVGSAAAMPPRQPGAALPR